jgi:hypothetical protein
VDYAIYQIGKIEVLYKFRDYDSKKFDFKDYVKVYEGHLDNLAVDHALSVLWRTFNLEHPADYQGHSLSMSDIILLDSKYYYCQSIGWKEIEVND